MVRVAIFQRKRWASERIKYLNYYLNRVVKGRGGGVIEVIMRSIHFLPTLCQKKSRNLCFCRIRVVVWNYFVIYN